jgi:hypothetical protein
VATMYTRIERYCSEDPELAMHLRRAYKGILQKPAGAGDQEQSQKYYIRAGGCYAEAGKDMEASDAFYKAKEFTEGDQHARKAANFDRAVETVQSFLGDQSKSVDLDTSYENSPVSLTHPSRLDSS